MPDTPFEELEQLADYLPEEGEAILISRKHGELVCEPFRQPVLPVRRDPLDDPLLYGYLVQANERLRTLRLVPLWTGLLGWFWGCVLMHTTTSLGWSAWYLDFGLALAMVLSVALWVQERQARAFHRHYQAPLLRNMRQVGLDRHIMIGALRHHPELRTLFHHLIRWE